MRRTTYWLLALMAIAAGVTGCRHTCCKKAGTIVASPPPGAIIVPQPRGAVITPVPGPAAAAPEVLQPAPPPPNLTPPPAAAAPSGYPPIAKADEPAPTIRLLPPELGESVAKAPTPEPEPAAPKTTTPAPTTTLPVGIPDFASAIGDKVANGRKPMLDGLDWLKTNGYRGALLLRKPGESDAADRAQFESRGLSFVSLEITLTGLDRATVDHFDRLVADAGRIPLFVYDADGSLTGPMWYLHFRRVEKLDDAAARAKAERLGLKINERDQRLGWLAIQDFLSKNP